VIKICTGIGSAENKDMVVTVLVENDGSATGVYILRNTRGKYQLMSFRGKCQKKEKMGKKKRNGK
jgi:hypothetical protein